MSAVAEKELELAIVVEGKVVQNNFPDFKQQLETVIADINTDLETDADFGQAKQDSKQLKEVNKKLDEALEKVFKDLDEINTIREGVMDLKGQATAKSKALDDLIKTRTDEVKKDLVDTGIAELDLDCPAFRKAVQDSIFRKSSLVKMKEAIDATVDKLNEQVTTAKAKVSAAREDHGESVVYGETDLLQMSEDTLTVELERRIERHKAELEKQKLIAEKEAAEKAAKEAAAAKEAEYGKTTLIDTNDTLSANPDSLPDPPKIGSIPTSQPAEQTSTEPAQEESQAEELQRFKATAELGFAPIRIAREKLKHPENIKIVGEFAKSLGAGWTTLKKHQ